MVANFFRHHNTIRFAQHSVVSYKRNSFDVSEPNMILLKLPAKQLHSIDKIIEKIAEPFIADVLSYDNGIDSLTFQNFNDSQGNVIFLCKVEGIYDPTFLFEKWNECTENLGYMTRAENLKAKIAEHEKSLIAG